MAPAQVRFVLSVLDLRPGDRVPEIGSGPGVATALVCDELSSGQLVALGRSQLSACSPVSTASQYPGGPS